MRAVWKCVYLKRSWVNVENGKRDLKCIRIVSRSVGRYVYIDLNFGNTLKYLSKEMVGYYIGEFFFTKKRGFIHKLSKQSHGYRKKRVK